jgi:uncharacterized protein (UPF0254 family)
MKFLKYLGLAIAVIIVVLLIAALFVPKEYTVSTSIIIKSPKVVVYDYVKILKNQENYSVWVMADKALVPVYGGVDGTVGATQSWNSMDDNVGEGSQEIVKISEDRIDVDLKFVRPFKSEAKAAMLLKAIDSTQTELVSEFYGTSSYPMNLMNFVGINMIKDAEGKNLNNIKAILEKNP